MLVPMKQSSWTCGESFILLHAILPSTDRFSGTRFVLSRDELLTLPEFVLLSLFPNGLFPEGHTGGPGDSDALQVDVSTQLVCCYFQLYSRISL